MNRKSMKILVILLFIFISLSPLVIGFKSEKDLSGDSIKISTNIDWPMFQHDNNRSGCTISSGPLTNNVLWACQIDDKIYPSPALVDNKIYIGGERIHNSIHCLNAETGEEIWERNIYGGIRCSPTVVNDRVYIGSDENNGNFYCLNANNGSIIWQYPTGYAQASPLIYDGKVYIGTNYDQNFYCLDAYTGQEIWTVELGDRIQSPVLFNGKIYTATSDYSEGDYTYCLDASDGDVLWTYWTDSSFQSPLIYDEKLYISDWDGYVYCLDLDNGQLLWKIKSNGNISTASCVSNGKVYFADRHFYLYCIDAWTGENIWEFNTPTGHEIFVSPILADGLLYFGYTGGYVYCFDASSGEEIWRYDTTENVRSSFAIVDSKLYVTTYEGWIYCFGGESDNNPPNTPQIPEGPVTGYVGEMYTYNTTTFDIDGDQIFYKWDSDFEETDWLGPFNSNETISVNFTWDYTGTYNVRVIVRDTNYATSEWATLEVTMPVNQQELQECPLMDWFFQHFPNAFPLIKNLIK